MAGDAHRNYEIRCPVHGFIALNDWERGLIDQPAFQRLRRIRQLAWTDLVYPGAMHTRFEHSLGVMHTASLLYDSVVRKSADVLRREFAYTDEGLARDRQLVRLAALLHDVGHSPFSHAGEELFPEIEGRAVKFGHEDYSAAIIRSCLRSAIEDHPLNQNAGFTAEQVAALIEGSAEAKRSLFWRTLIDGQMDADRMDYLLRDSCHIGVHYGKFDLHRLISSAVVAQAEEGSGPQIGIEEGGWHAAEALVLARYFMFTQVYFHKTRVAYDIHLRQTLKELLPNGEFPKPTEVELDQFLKWDDWRVLGLLSGGQGGEHGKRLVSRNHYREVYHTPEVFTEEELQRLNRAKGALGDLLVAEESAEKSWYKTGPSDISVLSSVRHPSVLPLSKYSKMIENMKGSNQVLLYVDSARKVEGKQRIREALEKND